LSSLPKTLDETYDRILLGLESTGQLHDAVTALQWLCYSTRPLQLLEIRDVLAIANEGDGGFYPEDRLPDPFDIMVVCSSLISCNEDISGNDHATDTGSSSIEAHDDSVDADSTTQVRLAHFSVQEFLLSDRCRLRSDFQMQTCHRVMAEGCLHYLLYLSEKGPLTQEIVDQHPLAQYAAESWWRHAQKVESMREGAILDLVLRLLTNGNATLLLWVQLYNIDKLWEMVDLSRTISDVCPSLYYAALIGLPEVVERLLDAGADVDAEGGECLNALRVATDKRHEKVVQMLLDAGADVNTVGEGWNALQAASSHGDEKVVQMLLDGGADVNATGGGYGNALQLASERGHEKVVQMLLDAGAVVNAVGGEYYYGNALQAASKEGHEKVVQMLLDAGADVDATGDYYYGNALCAASGKGHEKVVQMLLHAGADFEVEDSYYGGNALHAASTGGHKKLERILIDWDLTKFKESYDRTSREVR
jgi:ankyrin repeat protein